jgi:hypothetical protein
MRPPRPTIDYEPQSANQMRTRPSALKATFSAELVAKGWPRNGADQTIPQNIRQRFGAHSFLDTQGMPTRPNGMSFYGDHSSEERASIVVTTTHLSGIAVQHRNHSVLVHRWRTGDVSTPNAQHRWITIEAFSGSPVHHLKPHDRAVICPLRDPFHIHHRLAQAHWHPLGNGSLRYQILDAN